MNHTDPPPCQGCRQARESNESWHAGELDRRRRARAAAKAVADACQVCHGTNWIPDTEPAVKCNHQEVAVNERLPKHIPCIARTRTTPAGENGVPGRSEQQPGSEELDRDSM